MENLGKKSGEGKLSDKEKIIANSLEYIPYLEPKDRVFLLLVWRGFKTASPVSVEPPFKENALELKERVEKAGLFFKDSDIIIKKPTYGLRPGLVCFVSNNQGDLGVASKLFPEMLFGHHLQSPKIYKEFGRISGFPRTSIDAYGRMMNKERARDVMISEDQKIEKLKNEPDLIPFATLFYMSLEHFENEMKTVRKWAEEIKFVAPDLYISFNSGFQRFRDRPNITF